MATKSKVLWFLLACILALGASIAFAPAALAGQPPKSETTSSDPYVITDVCEFPVNVVANLTAVQKFFFDGNGMLTRIGIHTVEQDVFTANGITILGEPFTFNTEVLFDENGEIPHVYASGVVARIPLPDGSVFLSAGRIDFIDHVAHYVLSADKGNPGDIAAFCEAFTP
jgi:hypothetical protein